MKLIIVRDEYGFRIRQSLDQFHPLFRTKQEAHCAERIAGGGRIRQDRHAEQMIVLRHAGVRIQQMMVSCAA